MTVVIYLDVSELEPPQPMREITKLLAELPLGRVLHVYHRRKPVPLFDMIAEKYDFSHQEIKEGCHYIYIWNKNDVASKEHVRTLTHENDGS